MSDIKPQERITEINATLARGSLDRIEELALVIEKVELGLLDRQVRLELHLDDLSRRVQEAHSRLDELDDGDGWKRQADG